MPNIVHTAAHNTNFELYQSSVLEIDTISRIVGKYDNIVILTMYTNV